MLLPKLARHLTLELAECKGRRDVPALELSAFACHTLEDSEQSPRLPPETSVGPQPLPQAGRLFSKKVLFSKPQQTRSPVKKAQIKTIGSLGSLSSRSGLSQAFKPQQLLGRSPSLQPPAPHYYMADLKRDVREVGAGLEASKQEHQHAFFKHFLDCHRALLGSRGLTLRQNKMFEMPPRGTPL
jgi:hypothetical protein